MDAGRVSGYAERIMAMIRQRDPELADAIDREDAEPGWHMTDEMLARYDAWLTGQGYLVNGRRVDPVSVVIVSAPRETEPSVPGRRGCILCGGGTCLTPCTCEALQRAGRERRGG